MKCELFLAPNGIEEDCGHDHARDEVYVTGMCCVTGTNIIGKAKVCVSKEMAQEIRIKRGQVAVKMTVELVDFPE